MAPRRRRARVRADGAEREIVHRPGGAGGGRPLQPRGARAASCCSARARSRSTPRRGEIVGDDRRRAGRRCLENLQAVCAAAGTTLERALRLTVYMTDLGAFAAVNEVYASFFAEPSRRRGSTVGVAALPKGA